MVYIPIYDRIEENSPSSCPHHLLLYATPRTTIVEAAFDGYDMRGMVKSRIPHHAADLEDYIDTIVALEDKTSSAPPAPAAAAAAVVPAAACIQLISASGKCQGKNHTHVTSRR